jgi:hypothetical protein
MASPGLEEGYLRYAHTLDAALAFADFGKAERVVLRHVFAQVFDHLAPRKLARLRPGRLAAMTGVNKQNLIRTIRRLVEFGVLERRSQFRYRFIKNYESWKAIRRGKLAPRFTPEELKAIGRAKADASYYRHDQHDRGVSPGIKSVSPETPGGVSPETSKRCHQRLANGVTRDTLNTKSEELREEGTPSSLTAPLIPGRSSVVGEVVGLDVLASTLFPDDHDLGYALAAFAGRYSAEWAEAALWCAFASKVARPRTYINACLGKWKRRGSIDQADAATADAARSSPAAPVPAEGPAAARHRSVIDSILTADFGKDAKA